MQGLYRLVARVMNTTMPVLITGESGTGKSLIARAIHDFSDRRSLPFVVVSGADLEGMEGPQAALRVPKAARFCLMRSAICTDVAQGRIVRMLDALGRYGPADYGDLAIGSDGASGSGHVSRRSVLPSWVA